MWRNLDSLVREVWRVGRSVCGGIGAEMGPERSDCDCDCDRECGNGVGEAAATARHLPSTSARSGAERPFLDR